MATRRVRTLRMRFLHRAGSGKGVGRRDNWSELGLVC